MCCLTACVPNFVVSLFTILTRGTNECWNLWLWHSLKTLSMFSSLCSWYCGLPKILDIMRHRIKLSLYLVTQSLRCRITLSTKWYDGAVGNFFTFLFWCNVCSNIWPHKLEEGTKPLSWTSLHLSYLEYYRIRYITLNFVFFFFFSKWYMRIIRTIT